jgi:hypothetical protein
MDISQRSPTDNSRTDGNKGPTTAPAISTKDGTLKLSPQNIARLWEKIDRKGPEECWNWTGGANDKGRGRVKLGGRLYSPYRVVFEIAYGLIPRVPSYHGMVIMHTCDNPACCNPTHLQLGRQRDNVHDMVNKNRMNAKRGTANYRALLTEDQVRAIRVDPRSERAVAAAYGVTKGCIGNVLRGRTWAHVK